MRGAGLCIGFIHLGTGFESVQSLAERIQFDLNVFISHDLGVIKHVSDRIAIMYLGRVVELCEASQIYENPLHPYTKALLSAIPPESPLKVRNVLCSRKKFPVPSAIRSAVRWQVAALTVQNSAQRKSLR